MYLVCVKQVVHAPSLMKDIMIHTCICQMLVKGKLTRNASSYKGTNKSRGNGDGFLISPSNATRALTNDVHMLFPIVSLILPPTTPLALLVISSSETVVARIT